MVKLIENGYFVHLILMKRYIFASSLEAVW